MSIRKLAAFIIIMSLFLYVATPLRVGSVTPGKDKESHVMKMKDESLGINEGEFYSSHKYPSADTVRNAVYPRCRPAVHAAAYRCGN